jgi:hypothetical protein
MLYSADVPAVYGVIADDPRPVSVLNLPFGLRDGLSSAGNHSAEYQFHQTMHQKPLIGGYVSRLPTGQIQRYRRFPVMSALFDLSEGRALTTADRQVAVATAHESARTLNVGWVVVDTRSASAALEALAVDAFDLTLVQSDGPWKLYRSALTVPES